MRCGPDVATVRAEPREGAEQLTQLIPGEPVVVEEVQGDWALVRTTYAYPGWVRVVALETGEGQIVADRADSPVDVARSYLGAPYLWGGMTERGIDCSGLVHMSFRRVGVLVPRDADQQEEAGAPVAEPQPGDLVTYGEATADHIAFWVGDGRILHSTGRDGGIGVVEEPEPAELLARRRRFVRFAANGASEDGASPVRGHSP